jgi:hypothetical protein
MLHDLGFDRRAVVPPASSRFLTSFGLTRPFS